MNTHRPRTPPWSDAEVERQINEDLDRHKLHRGRKFSLVGPRGFAPLREPELDARELVTIRQAVEALAADVRQFQVERQIDATLATPAERRSRIDALLRR